MPDMFAIQYDLWFFSFVKEGHILRSIAKASKFARALCPVVGLALCTHAVLAQQPEQQTPAKSGVLGMPVEKAAPPQVPPGSRPPDQMFHAISSWSLGALAFSPDGHWLASGGYGDTVMVWNAATGAEQGRLSRPQPPNNAVVKLAFSPDGTHLAELRYNGKVTIWDFQKATVVSSTKLRSGAGAPFVFSPDGKHGQRPGRRPKKDQQSPSRSLCPMTKRKDSYR